jgi:predicted GTPase
MVFPFDMRKGNTHAKAQQLQITQTQGMEQELETAVSRVSKSISTVEVIRQSAIGAG